jgi:hypothetical protein
LLLLGAAPSEGTKGLIERRTIVKRRFVSSAAGAAAGMVLGLLMAAGCGQKAGPAGSGKEPGTPEHPGKAPDASAKVAKAPAAAGGMVDLAIVLPKPAFIGTPKNIRTPNLEPPKGDKPRPPFKVPAGTKLLSFKKSISASDEDPIIGEIEQITDGDKEAGDGSYVELGPGLQWVQLDLGAEYHIDVILSWHYHGDPRVYHDVVVQVADDPDFITGVKIIYNNDHDNSSGLGIGKHYEYFDTFEGRLMDAGGVKSRYVRLYSNGSTADEMNRYTEVEIFGRPVGGT